MLARPLQPILDRVPAGSLVELPAGTFEGPVVLQKPLILTGKGAQTRIVGDGNGTVVTVRSDRVTLKNLTIRRSGRQRYRLDAAVRIERSDDVRVVGCQIEASLFGIVAFGARRLDLESNSVRSYPDPVVDNRGDGIRLWQVQEARVRSNRLEGGRDLALHRCRDINLTDNLIAHGRHGVLLEMDRRIRLSGNRIRHCYAGIVVKGGEAIVLEGNTLFRTRTATGTGILLAGGREISVRHNLLVGHPQAIYIDAKATERDGIRRIVEYNTILDNLTAFRFHGVIKNNRIRYNDIVGNLDDVWLNVRPAKRYFNEISCNYWDRYRGFDRNGDGVGDTPYLVLLYADRLWQFDHHLKLFYGTPVLSLVDLMERLAPFSEPIELMRDPRPLMDRVEGELRRVPPVCRPAR